MMLHATIRLPDTILTDIYPMALEHAALLHNTMPRYDLLTNRFQTTPYTLLLLINTKRMKKKNLRCTFLHQFLYFKLQAHHTHPPFKNVLVYFSYIYFLMINVHRKFFILNFFPPPKYIYILIELLIPIFSWYRTKNNRSEVNILLFISRRKTIPPGYLYSPI